VSLLQALLIAILIVMAVAILFGFFCWIAKLIDRLTQGRIGWTFLLYAFFAVMIFTVVIWLAGGDM
jgi:hypothetical protein